MRDSLGSSCPSTYLEPNSLKPTSLEPTHVASRVVPTWAVRSHPITLYGQADRQIGRLQHLLLIISAHKKRFIVSEGRSLPSHPMC